MPSRSVLRQANSDGEELNRALIHIHALKAEHREVLIDLGERDVSSRATSPSPSPSRSTSTAPPSLAALSERHWA